jgi:hypothetical protein
MIVVIAEKEELKLVEELGYADYPVLITGVGSVNVIKALKDLPKDTDILNIGYCGSNTLPIGTTVYIQDVKSYHETANFNEPTIPLDMIRPLGSKCCSCYTSTDFVLKTRIKEPCVFDMELSFIASMFDNVRSIKIVSDNLNYKEFNKTKNI